MFEIPKKLVSSYFTEI